MYLTGFTFHYGSIQIKTIDKCVSMAYKFTFHYGSIQINIKKENTYIQICIYIPLWFYSNQIYQSYIWPVEVFTFHYGSIQICSRFTISQN